MVQIALNCVNLNCKCFIINLIVLLLTGFCVLLKEHGRCV